MGVELQGLNADQVKLLGLEDGIGLIVTAVWRRGPAFKAGLWPGDVLVEFEGKEIRTGSGVNSLVAEKEPGATVKIKYYRREQQKFVDKIAAIVLERQPKDWGRSRENVEP